MGSGVTKRKEERFRKATENPERIKLFTEKFGISEKEVQQFFKLFDGVDRDKSGEISIDEFFRLFDLDWSTFGKNIFAAMDASGDNQVEFVEFFVGLWNYCTLGKESLAKFAFDLFDFDGSGSIDAKEFKELIAMIHGKKKIDGQAEKLLKVFDRDNSGTVTFQEFLENVKKTPSLLMEAFTLQRNMREKCMGISYWNKASKKRAMVAPDHDLMNLYNQMYHGESLNRSANKQAAFGEKVACVKFPKMTKKSRVAIFEDPASNSKRIGKLLAHEYVFVVEELETEGKEWVRIKEDELANRATGWAPKKYFSFDTVANAQ
eukprot:snap_masked-scaffold_15-processed-gene-6.2-mRNA-1 protein AED:0.33 eAED:0.33 QI:0/0/0/0.25/1/1/4/0/318